MRPANPQQQLNDDGTPRRKYEPDDAVSSKYVLRASIGFVLANAFLIAKNLMFGAEPAQKQSPLLMNTAMKEGDEHATGQDPIALEDDETYGDGIVGDQPDGGTVRLLHSALSASHAFGDLAAARTASGPTFDQTHGNDNVALYGAAPGRPIVIFSGDDGRDSLPLSGSGGGGSGGSGSSGGGSGGGSSGGGSSGHHDDPGPGDQSGDSDGDGEQDPLPRFNRLPVIAGPVILPALLMNQSVVIALSDLLRNASDPDGDQLTVRDFTPSSGTLQARGDGSWNFTPTSGDTSDVTFTYTVSDGNGGSAQATAALDLVPADRNVDTGRPDTIIGTDGPDTIVGTPYADVIDALSGDDIVLGREGDDVIFGGDGNDRIVAGDGNDVVYAGAGDDVVFGGAGRDTIFGGAGNDLLFGDEGDDVLIGEAGNDTIWGGTGNDRISGGAGDDNLYGEDGDDFLDGGAGHNYLDGGAGDDTILVRTGDTALGATGNDTFILAAHSSTPPTPVADPGPAHSSSSEAGEDDDHDTVLPEASEPDDTSSAAAQTDAPAQVTETSHQNPTALSKAAVTQILSIADDPIDVPENHDEITHIDGGGDRDTIDASGLSAPLTLNLKIGAATSTDIGYVTIVDVEDVKGGSGANTIVGSDVDNNLTGGANSDT